VYKYNNRPTRQARTEIAPKAHCDDSYYVKLLDCNLM